METPRMMAVHGAAIALLAYVVMITLFKESKINSEKRAVILGAVATIYMTQFGHKLPYK